MYSKSGPEHPCWKGGRYKRLGYWYIKKPHYIFTNKDGYIGEHRYIMYIYLSILNNKIVYIPKDMDVHHIDDNRANNVISNLQILPKNIHRRITKKGKKCKRKDMSGRCCLTCKSKITYIDKDTERPIWYKYNNGYICSKCRIRKYKRETYIKKVSPRTIVQNKDGNPIYIKFELVLHEQRITTSKISTRSKRSNRKSKN